MNFREEKRDRSEDRGDHRAGCQSVYPDRDDRAGRFFEAFACGIKRTKADFSKIFHTRIFWKIQDTLKEQAKGLYIQLEKNSMDCRREMERVQIAQDDEKNDVWKQLLSLQLPPQKEVLDCVETICQSGEAKEKEQEEKNAQEEKRADAIQMELKNRQNTNHLFELLKKTRDQLEILKGQETKDGRNAKTDPCSNPRREGGCSRRTIAENKGRMRQSEERVPRA